MTRRRGPPPKVAAPSGAVVPSRRSPRRTTPGATHPRGSCAGYACARWIAQEEPVLRKVAAAGAALPVLAVIYLAALARAGLIRVAATVIGGLVIGIIFFASLPPTPTSARPASVPAPVEARLLDAVLTGQPLTRPFTVEFDGPMDPASVAAALRLEPETAVTFSWDAWGRSLRIAPLGHWQPDTLYSVTVAPTARSADGGVLAHEVRSLMLTSRAGSATIAETTGEAGRIPPTASFRIALDRPVATASVEAAPPPHPTNPRPPTPRPRRPHAATLG